MYASTRGGSTQTHKHIREVATVRVDTRCSSSRLYAHVGLWLLERECRCARRKRTYRRMLAYAYTYAYAYAYASSCVLARAYSHRGSDVHARPWMPSACTRRACPTLTCSRPCAHTCASSCRCGSLVQARARAQQRRGRSAHRAFHTPRTPRKYLTQGAVCWS
jgi:hypothetical protein